MNAVASVQGRVLRPRPAGLSVALTDGGARFPRCAKRPPEHPVRPVFQKVASRGSPRRRRSEQPQSPRGRSRSPRPPHRQLRKRAWSRARRHPVRQVFQKAAFRACHRRRRRDCLRRHARAAVVTVRRRAPAKPRRAGRAGPRLPPGTAGSRPRSGRNPAPRRRRLKDRRRQEAGWVSSSPACSVRLQRRRPHKRNRRPSQPGRRHGRRRSKIGRPARLLKGPRKNRQPS